MAYIEAFDYIKANLNKFREDLFSDVELWVKSNNSIEYISEKEQQEINEISVKLENKCENINNELINRRTLSQPLAIKPLKQKLVELIDNKSSKRQAEKWYEDLRDIEKSIEKLILINDDLFESYLEYCCRSKRISSVVFKLICQINEINITLYSKLDTHQFELVEIENDIKCETTWKKQLHLRLNENMFCQIELQETSDTNVIEASQNQSTTAGYLQTFNKKIHLKSGYHMEDIAEILRMSYSDIHDRTRKLFEEIRRNISLIKNASCGTNLFLLHQIIGDKPIPTKKDILYLLKEIDKIVEWNPFIANHKDVFYEKIECYLAQETLVEQIRRVTLLILKYESLVSENDKDEKGRILEIFLPMF